MPDRIIAAAVGQLITFLDEAISRSLEPVRLARDATVLLLVGNNESGKLFRRVVAQLIQSQRPDGGWSDPEETAWAISCISMVRGLEDPAVRAAIQWLHTVRLSMGGWSRYPRDQARIPITALISTLVPAAFKSEDLNWLQNEWASDFRGPVRLSYKAGFYLLVMPQGQEDDLVARTISHLADDQNDDGGFAPWKGHPIGSDPWSTGVVLWGLSRWGNLVERIVIERALGWLQKTQLPSGYWPYHYLDEGTSLALIGAVSAMKALAGRK